MSDYRIKVTVRNAKILRAIEKAGFKSQAEFARHNKIPVNDLNALVALRRPPVNADGNFCTAAQQVLEALCALPEDLWTEDQLFMKVERSTYETDVCTSVAQQLLGTVEQRTNLLIDMKREVETAMDKLTTREREILCMRFYEEKTLRECGEVFGVSRNRIRQIEAKALRKCRHPSVAARLKDFVAKD